MICGSFRALAISYGNTSPALAILVFAVNMLGDGLRDVLDPRLRGGIGRYGIKIKKVPTVKKDTQLSQSENHRE
jgi:hypothetical protein